jgi:hypothetical protein
MVSHVDPFGVYRVTKLLVPSCDGSFQYHGGTNFGRTAGGPFIATSYDYDAPIDEYGKFSLNALFIYNVCRTFGTCIYFKTSYHVMIAASCIFFFWVGSGHLCRQFSFY